MGNENSKNLPEIEDGYLRAHGTGLEEIPNELITKYKSSITKVNLSCNSISKIPDNCSQFSMLTHLNLNFNRLETIPAEISKLVNLQYFHAAHNQIAQIHPNICSLTKLIEIDFSYNYIEEIPSNISSLPQLKTLFLNDNLLTDIPDSLYKLKNLEIFSLFDNPFMSDAISHFFEIPGMDLLPYLMNYLHFRYLNPLPERFTAFVYDNRPAYYDNHSQCSYTTDPRYFLFVRTLNLADQRVFTLAGEPPQLLFVKTLTTLDRAPVPLSSSENSSSSSSSNDVSVIKIVPVGVCSNFLCMNQATTDCLSHCCILCCKNTKCESPTHKARRNELAPSTFATRQNHLGELLKEKHLAEPEIWKEKPRLRLMLRRTDILSDSLRDIMRANRERLVLRLNVQYLGETGLDYGGLSREWFSLMSTELVKPDIALFKPCELNRGVYLINPLSGVNPTHLHYFRFVGRVLAKGLFDSFQLGIYFTPNVYKYLKGEPMTFDDLKVVDPEMHQSLSHLENEDVTDLGLTFSMDIDVFGETRSVEFIEGGTEIDVTNENKLEFIKLKTHYILHGQIRAQLESLKYGFNELISPSMIEFFTHKELEELLSGLCEIDVDDWKRNTQYLRCQSDCRVVQWFWQVVKSYNNAQRMELFQFVTGNTKVPMGGFAKLYGANGPRLFTITQLTPVQQTSVPLPSCHTCFNQIDLIEYASYEIFAEKLHQAVEWAGTGFGEK